MKISRAVLIYFSPTGGTKRVAELFGQRLGIETEKMDITSGEPERNFAADELAVFAFPVYGGRIPAPIHERMKNINGCDTPAVMLAVYGNRAVDDAGLEMSDAAEKQGFRTVAAAEFVAPHSVCRSYGSGRPDEKDLGIMDEFVSKLLKKLEGDSICGVEIPGSRPYVDYNGIPIKPSVKKNLCSSCGRCAAHCPSGAIDPQCPQKTDKAKCISCMGCISVCPTGARHISPVFKLAGKLSLKKICSGRKEPRYFI
ncbi:MAG: 4Fe-4S binding protein [Candidatus Limivicinus sp.]